MNMMNEDADMGHDVVTAETGTLAILSGAEINQQIATARQYPRSIKRFFNEARQLVTLTESVAMECIYALPRDGKTIEGPSARFAEIMAHSWGNSRAGARVIDDKGDFVTAQGVFHDLEKNVAITYEVKRRITDRRGNRYSADMIGVTANAACSIALRNAILKGVPKALWNDIYQDARHVIMGDSKTLANRRADALAYLQKFGATESMVLELLGVEGVEDITMDHLVVLRGLATAIKDGDTTVEEAFKPSRHEPSKETTNLNEKLSTGHRSNGGQDQRTASATNQQAAPTWPEAFTDEETGKQGWVDSADEYFDPTRHAMSDKGIPAVKQDGTFRARRGTVNKDAPPPTGDSGGDDSGSGSDNEGGEGAELE